MGLLDFLTGKGKPGPAPDALKQTAEAAPKAKEAGSATAETFYVVKAGDTLWKIAEAHYGAGKGAKYMEIFEANRPMLTDPDKIQPGQRLRIPQASAGPLAGGEWKPPSEIAGKKPS
ncbi:MAG: LysM peptidoglycan-binding domain-containing protein [Alphaproteobacteria bacterium]|jgi:nucleoid-associated protein YgaU|nr:LysM peptidoglycan-binding domain-containing protein [Alphaproteobacteria bacterium]MBM3624507.1 LysM peptidoglycan-binding domain-containing protein [Alphaproteobacteria bacterium]MBM3640955.1 LysM peptidoglycan-binding domain-containing protein [Alphaproteobacteria bacterium]